MQSFDVFVAMFATCIVEANDHRWQDVPTGVNETATALLIIQANKYLSDMFQEMANFLRQFIQRSDGDLEGNNFV